MKEFKSYSQAGQDRFAYELIGDKGTFLDIGANHPIEKNNTYGLERLGWTGILVEQDAYCVGLLQAQRTSPVISADATTYDWSTLPQKHFNFISLDVDIATELTLRGLLEHGIKFDVMTVEHDKYRFGPGPQRAMQKMLVDAGYFPVCFDVHDQGLPFEDWWVCSDLDDEAQRLKSDGEEWQQIIARI